MAGTIVGGTILGGTIPAAGLEGTGVKGVAGTIVGGTILGGTIPDADTGNTGFAGGGNTFESDGISSFSFFNSFSFFKASAANFDTLIIFVKLGPLESIISSISLTIESNSSCTLMTFCSTTLGSDSGAFLSSFFPKKIFFILSTMEVDLFSSEGLSCSVTGGTIPGAGLEGTGVKGVAGTIVGGTILGGTIPAAGLEGTGVSGVAGIIGGGVILGGTIPAAGLEGTGVSEVAGIIGGVVILGVNIGGVGGLVSLGLTIPDSDLPGIGLNGAVTFTIFCCLSNQSRILRGPTKITDKGPFKKKDEGDPVDISEAFTGSDFLAIKKFFTRSIIETGFLSSLTVFWVGGTIVDSPLIWLVLRGVTKLVFFCWVSNQSKIFLGPINITDNGPFIEGTSVFVDVRGLLTSWAFTGSSFFLEKILLIRSLMDRGFFSSGDDIEVCSRTTSCDLDLTSASRFWSLSRYFLENSLKEGPVSLGSCIPETGGFTTGISGFLTKVPGAGEITDLLTGTIAGIGKLGLVFGGFDCRIFKIWSNFLDISPDDKAPATSDLVSDFCWRANVKFSKESERLFKASKRSLSIKK